MPDLHFIPFGGGGDASMTLEMTNLLVKTLSKIMVGPSAYFMPVGGHTPVGCLGYVDAALELHEQIEAMDWDAEKVTLVTAVGTGGTLAGLMAGLRLINSPLNLLGIDIGKLWKAFPSSLAHLATEICAILGATETFLAEDVPMIEATYAGPGYSILTDETKDAIRTLAQTEGILLDPVYTGKAFAGMLDLIGNGRFAPDHKIIFLHTGGTPGLWAYSAELA